MVNAIFNKAMAKTPKSKLESVTLNGFAGGWNAVDDDLVMKPNYVKDLLNFFRNSSGGQILHYGQNFFVDIKDVHNSNIVDQIYYNSRIIAVCADGWMVSVTDAGTKTVIWSPAIAAALPGAPGFWTAGFKVVTFVPFKNQLAIHNGQDKPVVVDSSFAVQYLSDLATGSNVNVPIGKFACVASNYHCVAGIAGSPTTVYISATGTVGTFPLDPTPNDAISIDVGAYAPEGAAAIRGIAGFRSFLLVFLQEITLQVQLGVFDSGGKHTPKFPDTFPKFGLIGSRCITTIENDIIFSGLQGLSSAKRNTYVASQLDSTTVSSVIEPEYQRRIAVLTEDQKAYGTFSVYDRLGHNLMLFIPDGSVLIYTSNEKLGYKAWSRYDDMAWTSGCTTLLGRVFLSSGTKIFQLGNATYGEKYYANRLNDRDGDWAVLTSFTVGQKMWDTVTLESYVCAVDHISGTGTFAADRADHPTYWTLYLGEAINFALEMPWFEGKDPMKIKKLRFVTIATRGTATFTLEAYVDNLYKDYGGNVIYDPALSMDFVGNDAPGFGVDPPTAPLGTGRRSRDPRLYSYPVKFKSIKFRLIGSTREPLEIIKFGFIFSRGRYFR